MANAKGHLAGSDDLLLKPEQSSAPTIVGWFAGALIFASVMGLLLHFADIAELLAVLKAASPLWIAAAVSCQLGTHACAAAVWQMVTRRAGFQLRLADLLKLAVMELFANQAIPTGGQSGSLLVARGLVRRRIPSSIAITALLVAALSYYYAAYLLMAGLAFALLWSTGDLSDKWEWLSIMFAAIVILITVCLVAVTVTKGRWIPRPLLRTPLMARLAKAACTGSDRHRWRSESIRPDNLLSTGDFRSGCHHALVRRANSRCKYRPHSRISGLRSRVGRCDRLTYPARPGFVRRRLRRGPPLAWSQHRSRSCCHADLPRNVVLDAHVSGNVADPPGGTGGSLTSVNVRRADV